MRIIDADEAKRLILKERDAIPLSCNGEPFRFGEAMRGGIRKALRCIEQTEAIGKDRIVILPCKIGDTVEFGDVRYKVSQFVMFEDGKLRYVLEDNGYILRPEVTDERVIVL